MAAYLIILTNVFSNRMFALQAKMMHAKTDKVVNIQNVVSSIFISTYFSLEDIWVITFSSHLSWPSPCTGPAIILVIQYFRYCAMSSVSWYFFMSPGMLSLHLFLGRPLLLLPQTSSSSDFAQMWSCSRLKQWTNHFSLLFSRKVSTGLTLGYYQQHVYWHVVTGVLVKRSDPWTFAVIDS